MSDKSRRTGVSEARSGSLDGHPFFLVFPNDYSVRDRNYKRAALHPLQHNQSNNHNPGTLIAQ